MGAGLPQRRQKPSQLEISARGLLARWIPTDLNASLPEPESVFRTPEQIRAELAARGISADFAAELINGMGSSGNGLDAPTTHPSATPIPSDKMREIYYRVIGRPIETEPLPRVGGNPQ